MTIAGVRSAYLSLADRIRIERVGDWLEQARAGDRVLIAAAVLLAAFPLMMISGYHYEEGLTVAFAKDATTAERWYDPQLYGFRFVERPVLQSWIVALVSLPFGVVTQVTARLPTVVAVIVCGFLIAHLLKGRASRQAILFAVLGVVFSPAILQKVAVAESEVLLTVFQFAAFVIWWKGHETGHVALWRWIAIGLLLLATACFKGPQPAAFFAIGVGVFIVAGRHWRELPGYALAGVISLGGLGVWYAAVLDPSDTAVVTGYMRLVPPGSLGMYLYERVRFSDFLVQSLPVILLAIPALSDLVRRRTDYTHAANRKLMLALALYGLALIPLALWPAALPRYAMSWLPASACLAALAYDLMRERALQFVRLAIGVLVALVVYQMVWAWLVAPAFWPDFSETRIDGKIIDAVATDRQRLLVAEFREADAILAYLDGRPIRYMKPEDLISITAPAYLVARPAVADGVAQGRPDLAIDRLAALDLRGLVLYSVAQRD